MRESGLGRGEESGGEEEGGEEDRSKTVGVDKETEEEKGEREGENDPEEGDSPH